MTDVLVIPADAPAYKTALQTDELAHLQTLVGGWIEEVPVGDGKTLFIVDEDGKSKQLLGADAYPVNERAGWLLRLAGRDLAPDYLSGTAVVVGYDAEGDLTDVPKTMLDLFGQIGAIGDAP